ncbi:pyruvate, phosphate dikinase [Aerococcaceae bacterium DSM 111021]|nr:pyruvate, phosphate dikinase [Aerococcaceae bacterium DSM 111021]
MMKHVYAFNEGRLDMKELLGGKGSNLAEMTRLGLPVPDGFVITTEACMDFLKLGEQLNDALQAQINAALVQLEKSTEKAFDQANNLLLVSVRSGATISMPGMMDTILNVGLNDANVERFSEMTQDTRFALDCYRRLLQMYGNVVYGIDMVHFDNILNDVKIAKRYSNDSELTAEDLKNIITKYKQVYLDLCDKPFPQDVKEQIVGAVEAVFKSWNNDRAKVYRRLNNIPDSIGTAVTIQEMVFGNKNEQSGTGVLFTRNPSTGENELYGEFLLKAQGEDVVAGIRTPIAINRLKETMPQLYDELLTMTNKLEQHYKDMQDVEFTIEDEKLYLLQTRNGKRVAKSAFKIAVDFVNEGVLTKEEALLTIDPESINQLLHPTFDTKGLSKAELITDNGLPASPGAATGHVVFDAQTAKEWTALGKPVILVRHETSPEDIEGMSVSEAIVTNHGGMTSHAAVVARGMGKCCVAGCDVLEINEESRKVRYPGGSLDEGDIISVNGDTGSIYVGAIETTNSDLDENYQTVMRWANEVARVQVRMNAETPLDIKTGLDFGATGIGLVRTEHMFFQPEPLSEIRRFILSNSDKDRKNALEAILVHQQRDFKQIFELIQDKPTVIRLLDMPLHEFLPNSDQDIELVSQQQNMAIEDISQRLISLNELNPMLGHRGCRLAMTFPGLYLMQAEAIILAAIELYNKGIAVKPEIMIPLVSTEREIAFLKEIIQERIESLLDQMDVQIAYTIGTMIETPRASLIADQIAQHSDFCSFGTNDMTQMTFGYSRDDAGKFLNQYVNEGVLAYDPFQRVDEDGVGELLKIAIEKIHEVNPEMKLGICGEHGGNPKSVELFDSLGFDYVSCSPYRIPIAQLAAAQSAIKLAQ